MLLKHDVDLHLEKIKHLINKLDMELVHIHPQNPAFVTSDFIPTQIETFSKNPTPINNLPKIPHHLDQPANPSLPEIELIFEE